MSLLSLIIALVIEQFRPLDYVRWIAQPLRFLANFTEKSLNAGQAQHGVIAWAILALGGALFVGLGDLPTE